MKGPGPGGNLASSLALCHGLKVGDVGMNILGEEETDCAPVLCPNAPTISVSSSGWSFRRCFREASHVDTKAPQTEVHASVCYFHRPSLRQLYVLADLINQCNGCTRSHPKVFYTLHGLHIFLNRGLLSF